MTNAIDTKLQPPQIGRKRLSRGKLLDRLTNPPGVGGLITIVAPAGSGKSTLQAELYESLAEPGHIRCWLSLDHEDNEPSNFAKYITTALYDLNESFAEKELTFLKANPARDFDAFFDSLISLISSSTQKTTLFIDDFQYLTDPKILRFWNRLIAHTPSTMCIVLASRVQLPLELGRKRMAGSLLEVTQNDLNLSPEQLKDFMLDLHNITLPTEAGELLHNTTEGWIAGLQLAALAISKEGDSIIDIIARFPTQDKDLKEYLFQSVLKVQAPETRSFLLHTAPLPKMTVDLCNTVTQTSNSEAMLEVIEQSNLFLIPLDRNKHWFRYHHLFAEFLQNELKRSDKDSYSQVCERAAAWYEEQGYLTEAIQYYLDGEQFDKAADLIAEHAPDVALYRGDHSVILDWMRRLPKKYHLKRPEIVLNHAWSLAFSRDNVIATNLSDSVLEMLDDDKSSHWEITEEERQSFKWLAQVIKVIALGCADETRRCADLCEKLIAEMPDSEAVLLASVNDTKSYCHYTQKEISKCAQASANAYLYGQEANSVYTIVWADLLLGLADIELGRINAADESANRCIKNAGPRTSNNSYVNGLAALLKAELETQRCNFDEVDHYLTIGKVFSSVFGPLEVMLLALRSEARLKAWKGSLGDARKVLHQGQDTALATHQPRLYFTLAAEEVDLQLRFDDVESAMDTIRRTNLLEPDHPLINSENKANLCELSRLTEAKLCIAKHQYDEAFRSLNLVYKNAHGNKRVMMQQHVRALKSIALWKSGREKEAVRELDKAISIAAPEGHAYPVISAGACILDILERIQETRTHTFIDEAHQIKNDFEKKLIALLRGENFESTSNSHAKNEAAELDEALTDRETEILKLVGAGLGNKQLADELLISISTVKWHLHNVYEKIGVRSRTAAAATARNMNLI